MAEYIWAVLVTTGLVLGAIFGLPTTAAFLGAGSILLAKGCGLVWRRRGGLSHSVVGACFVIVGLSTGVWFFETYWPILIAALSSSK